MKKLAFLLTFVLLALAVKLSAQKIYNTSSMEMFFSNGTFEFTDIYKQENPGAEIDKTPVRFTLFFNITNHWHLDLTNNIGLYTGLGIRNVGFVSDERLLIENQTTNVDELKDFKIIRRLYTGGIPFALKLGSFKDHLYLYGGGEIEFALHFKEKYWDSHDRSGSKTKYTGWFDERTAGYLPSVIMGAQFPGGLNVQFKYYLNNFLNHDYTDKNRVSDLTRYKTSQIWYISLSWQFNSQYLRKKDWGDGKEVAWNR